MGTLNRALLGSCGDLKESLHLMASWPWQITVENTEFHEGTAWGINTAPLPGTFRELLKLLRSTLAGIRRPPGSSHPHRRVPPYPSTFMLEFLPKILQGRCDFPFPHPPCDPSGLSGTGSPEPDQCVSCKWALLICWLPGSGPHPALSS